MTNQSSKVRFRRTRRLAPLGMILAAAVACSSSSSSASDPKPNNPSTTTTARQSDAGQNLRGKRYCEVLLVNITNGSGSGDVYNSFPMNECPEAQWTDLDAGAIAGETGASLAVLNGPRYWLMDNIENYGPPDTDERDFGGIAMTKRATVDIGPIADALTRYKTRAVSRSVVFSFDRGTTIYELTAADGSVYVMQSWSQQTDPALTEENLAEIGPQLTLPADWSFSSRTLTKPLVVDTRDAPAQVLQDDLGNSYSLLRDA